MPIQQIEPLTDTQQQALERVAKEMGMTPEDAASLLLKQGLARRMDHKTAKVIPWPGRLS